MVETHGALRFSAQPTNKMVESHLAAPKAGADLARHMSMHGTPLKPANSDSHHIPASRVTPTIRAAEMPAFVALAP